MSVNNKLKKKVNNDFNKNYKNNSNDYLKKNINIFYKNKYNKNKFIDFMKNNNFMKSIKNKTFLDLENQKKDYFYTDDFKKDYFNKVKAFTKKINKKVNINFFIQKVQNKNLQLKKRKKFFFNCKFKNIIPQSNNILQSKKKVVINKNKIHENYIKLTSQFSFKNNNIGKKKEILQLNKKFVFRKEQTQLLKKLNFFKKENQKFLNLKTFDSDLEDNYYLRQYNYSKTKVVTLNTT